MLLKDSINYIQNLGLGQAEFVLMKKVSRNSENLATLKQRLNFLKQCSDHNILPKTIDNIEQPFNHGIASLDLVARQRIKRFILNENKGTLRKTIAIKVKEQKQLDLKITAENLPLNYTQLQPPKPAHVDS